MWKRVATCLLAASLLLACKTPEGPALPLPVQHVSAPIPDGFVRVVFFNTTRRQDSEISIQLDGKQLPSIWCNRYVQVYAEPGEHELLFESRAYLWWWTKGRYTIEFEGPEVFLEVYHGHFSPEYKEVDELPADFFARFYTYRRPREYVDRFLIFGYDTFFPC